MITKVIAMEKILEQTLLYDFYGELLTEHQRQVYEDVVLNDFSLSEVAAARGISRQGVHDLVRRCNKTLEEYEEKLHLVQRFVQIRENVNEIRKQELTKEFLAMGVDELSVSPGSILPLRKIILETNVAEYKAGKKC